MDKQNPGASQLTGCLVRLFWMGAGNLILALAVIAIAQNHSGPFVLAWIDLLYWLTAAALPIVRYVDIRFLHGATADNQPATISHWRRYTVAVLATSLVLWVGAHLLS